MIPTGILFSRFNSYSTGVRILSNNVSLSEGDGWNEEEERESINSPLLVDVRQV